MTRGPPSMDFNVRVTSSERKIRSLTVDCSNLTYKKTSGIPFRKHWNCVSFFFRVLTQTQRGVGGSDLDRTLNGSKEKGTVRPTPTQSTDTGKRSNNGDDQPRTFR